MRLPSNKHLFTALVGLVLIAWGFALVVTLLNQASTPQNLLGVLVLFLVFVLAREYFNFLRRIGW